MQDNFLYIYLHIPKCAGTTIYKHICIELHSDNVLEFDESFYGSLLKGKSVAYISRDEKQKIQHEIDSKIEYKIKQMTESEREAIQIIYGHYVPYGIHKYFNKPARYITFLRDPFDLIVSAYNFFVGFHKSGKLPEHSKSFIMEKNCIMTFDHFIASIYDRFKINPFSSKSYLQKFGYLDKSFKESLEKFYFIGLVDTFDYDSLFLYNKLGILNFYPSENVSRKYIKMEESEISSLRKHHKKMHPEEYELYEYAVAYNARFKRNHSEFKTVVNKMRVKKTIQKISLYGQALLQKLYTLSATLKRHSILYAQIVSYVKKVWK